ncbi:unnamed protein product [Paramecium octaurelia]|uniref:Uncharacterized protein n=1 Tax=Paramecium octaurelia TaxID=43137 RepID=A0A8S1SMW8_PAROT|nr:unnamed protein product [Paramecium octaurelia]
MLKLIILFKFEHLMDLIKPSIYCNKMQVFCANKFDITIYNYLIFKSKLSSLQQTQLQSYKGLLQMVKFITNLSLSQYFINIKLAILLITITYIQEDHNQFVKDQTTDVQKRPRIFSFEGILLPLATIREQQLINPELQSDPFQMIRLSQELVIPFKYTHWLGFSCIFQQYVFQSNQIVYKEKKCFQNWLKNRISEFLLCSTQKEVILKLQRAELTSCSF